MNSNKIKKPLILGILFFLPVLFLLFLYPSTHNYDPLEIVKNNVPELENQEDGLKLKDQITVLGFFGSKPMDNVIAASNLKELIYDKFKGFKRFQVVVYMPEGSKQEYDKFKYEISQYEELEYWKFLFGSDNEIKGFYNQLLTESPLKSDLSTDEVFIIDKDLSQRGRIDDRADNEIERQEKIYPLYSYNCIEVAELKNKMGEDMRILFTEYRQKRKGNFDSSSRRADDIKVEDEKN